MDTLTREQSQHHSEKRGTGARVEHFELDPRPALSLPDFLEEGERCRPGVPS